MAKHRRTKKQKIKARERREVNINEGVYSIVGMVAPQEVRTITSAVSPRVTLKDYSFVTRETKRTIIVSTGLIVAAIFLKVLLSNNFIRFPF